MYERLKNASGGHSSLVKKISGDTEEALREKINGNERKIEYFT